MKRLRHELCYRMVCAKSLVLVLCAACVSGKYFEAGGNDNALAANSSFYERYIELDKALQQFMKDQAKRVLPTVLKLTENLNLSSSCFRDAFVLMRGVKDLKLWALNFLDASGKLPDGLLTGNQNLLGDFDQCLEAVSPGKNSFRGKYCSLVINLAAPDLPRIVFDKGYEDFRRATGNSSDVMKYVAAKAHLLKVSRIFVGVCVPSGCSVGDVEHFVNHLGRKVMIEASLGSCQVDDPSQGLDTRRIVIICLYCFFVLLGITASIIEFFLKNNSIQAKGRLLKVALCFSITSNFQKLVSTEEVDSKLSCLHGMRVLSLFHVIMSHEHLLIALSPMKRHVWYTLDYAKRFPSQIFVNGFFTVDVFFLIGGLVHSYVRVKRHRDSGKKEPSYFTIILLRVWRLAPAYVFSVLLMYLMEKRSPYSEIIKKLLDNNHWWKNFLFINNFYAERNTFFEPSWYVAADLHLFLGSLLVVGLIIQNPKKGIFLSSVLVVAGLFAGALWVYLLDGPPTMLFSVFSEQMVDAFRLSIKGTFCHIASYFAGIILGYVLATRKDIKLSMVQQVIGWPLAAFCSLSFLFGSFSWNNGAEYTRLGAAIYFSFGRFFYPLGAAWVIFCCATGHGGIVNYLLSLKMWIPLSRISYAAYLVHIVAQIFSTIGRKYVADVDVPYLVMQFFADTVLTCLLAFAISLLFESPSVALQKLAFQGEGKKTSPPAKASNGVQNGGFRPEDIRLEIPSNGKMGTDSSNL